MWHKIKETDNGICQECGAKATHILSYYKFGVYTVEKIACFKCRDEDAKMRIKEWMDKRFGPKRSMSKIRRYL